MIIIYAESKGFEPLKVVTPYFVSSEALSTTQPTLQMYILWERLFYYKRSILFPPIIS